MGQERKILNWKVRSFQEHLECSVIWYVTEIVLCNESKINAMKMVSKTGI